MNNATNALAFMHNIKSRIDFGQWIVVSNKFIDFQTLGQIFIDQFWYTFYTFPSTKGCSLPCTPGNQLEWSCTDFGACWSYANNDGNTPTFVCCLLKKMKKAIFTSNKKPHHGVVFLFHHSQVPLA